MVSATSASSRSLPTSRIGRLAPPRVVRRIPFKPFAEVAPTLAVSHPERLCRVPNAADRCRLRTSHGFFFRLAPLGRITCATVGDPHPRHRDRSGAGCAHGPSQRLPLSIARTLARATTQEGSRVPLPPRADHGDGAWSRGPAPATDGSAACSRVAARSSSANSPPARQAVAVRRGRSLPPGLDAWRDFGGSLARLQAGRASSCSGT